MLYESKLSREPFQGRAIPIFSKIPKKGSKKERQRLLSISTLMTPPSEKGRAQPHVQQLSACMGSFPFLLYVPPLKSKLCKRQTCLVMFVLFLEGRFIEGETLVLLLQGWFSASACFNVNTKRKTNSLKKKKMQQTWTNISKRLKYFTENNHLTLSTLSNLTRFFHCLQQLLKRKSCISKRCIRWAGILKEDLRTVECTLLAKEASFMEPETCPSTHPLPPCPSLSFLLRAIHVCKTGYSARPSSNPWESAWFDEVQWQSVYPQLSEYNVLLGKN